MTKISKKASLAAVIATAVIVECPIQQQRCRAGYMFKQGDSQRIELEDITPEALAAIEADPYLKVTYETEDMPPDDDMALQLELQQQAIKRAESAEARVTGLEAEMEAYKVRIAELEAHTKEADKLLVEYEERLAAQQKAADSDAKKGKAK